MSESVEELVARAVQYGELCEKEDLPEEKKEDFIQELQGESA